MSSASNRYALDLERQRPEAFRFGSKADTLHGLSAQIRSATILPAEVVTLGAWRDNRRQMVNRIFRNEWAAAPMIVRSSALGEDGADASHAGEYLSVLNVEGPRALELAVEQVYASYGDDHTDHQVLIQPMLRDVVASGVAFSYDPNTGAPYIVLNFSEEGDTEFITSGTSNDHRTLIISRSAEQVDDPIGEKVAALLKEVERLTGNDRLDIEFAIDRKGALFLLQARPLVENGARGVDIQQHNIMLGAVARRVAERAKPHPYLFGRRTVFGVMPDWNPAEIIGLRPKPLALSLYRELVTDSIWAYQRHNYGYRNLRSFPLLCDFYGMPFIDVRVSFNSFIPNDVPDDLAERLANYYIDALCERPSLHDKVEFEILFSCYTLDLPERLRELTAYGFSENDRLVLEESLRHLTNRIIADDGLWRKDLAKIETLQRRYETICAKQDDAISQVYWLLEDCKRYGTLPFAGLARAGFIAMQLLRSLVTAGALSEEDYQAFLSSLTTVSGEIAADFQNLTKSAFLHRYGHLRPGTYDICSPRYDAAPDTYFRWDEQADGARASHPAFALTLQQMNEISALLKEHNLSHNVVGLFNFLKAGIEGREKAKFHFTRNLSDAMEIFAEVGARHGFTREDLAFANIQAVHELYGTVNDPKDVLGRAIESGRAQYEKTKALILPSLITGADDVWQMEMGADEPNFITQRSIQANTVAPDNFAGLDGAIVMLPNADPGFDWLFSHKIGGLITAYGGVNSHMAIRAGELQIPAVIGAGESNFERWSGAKTLRIDCANRKVDVIA